MPVKCYFDKTGKVFYTEPLLEAMFFLPEGQEIERIDMSVPEEPVAVTKSIAGYAPEAIAEEVSPDPTEEA